MWVKTYRAWRYGKSSIGNATLFLSSLPDSYGTLIAALETRPEEDLTTELVKGKLLEELKRRSNVFPMQNELESKF